MAKRIYVTPAVDMLVFDYRNVVTASGGDEDTGYDASHCTFGSNPGGCGPSNYGQCKDYFNDNPGRCKNK